MSTRRTVPATDGQARPVGSFGARLIRRTGTRSATRTERSPSARINGSAWTRMRVLRGGGYTSRPMGLRAAHRFDSLGDGGFRVARTLTELKLGARQHAVQRQNGRRASARRPASAVTAVPQPMIQAQFADTPACRARQRSAEDGRCLGHVPAHIVHAGRPGAAGSASGRRSVVHGQYSLWSVIVDQVHVHGLVEAEHHAPVARPGRSTCPRGPPSGDAVSPVRRLCPDSPPAETDAPKVARDRQAVVRQLCPCAAPAVPCACSS